MSPLMPVSRGTTGLNNRIAPSRLVYNADTGMQALTRAVNVDIDSTGRIGRRKGYTATSRTEATHSLWCDGGECLFVSGSVLYRLNADYSRTQVTTGLRSGARMSYAQVADKAYYQNGFQKGIVTEGVNSDWSALDYVGPETTRTFSDPPIGTSICSYMARMYVASEDVLWYSEPFAYSWFDMARNWIAFPSSIRMLIAGPDALFISTDRAIYSLAGSTPLDFVLHTLTDYPAIEGTGCLIDGSMLGSGNITARIPLWATPEGVCVGLAGGMMQNLTHRTIVYPWGRYGASLFKSGRLIVTLEP